MTVLHVPFTYAPDPVGGTEVYVTSLAAELLSRGIESTVAAPGERSETYEVDGVSVDRYPAAPVTDVTELYDEGDPVAARAFGAVLDRRQPDVVHLHARTRAVSLRCLREATARGIPVVYTYHTPTGSCPRGTLLRWGTTPCDGELDESRCAACLLQAHGLPRPAALALAAVPATRWLPAPRRVRTALRMRTNVEAAHRTTRAFMAEADHVVAVSDWVEALLLRIGVPRERLTLSRQGLPYASDPEVLRAPEDGVLRVAFFGRLDPTKGLDVLLGALRLLPGLPLTLDVYAVAQGSSDGPWERRVRGAIAADPRVRLLPPVTPDRVVPTLRGYGLLAVPSQGLETGPLVVLEAFAAGVPVLGSRLGGIAERVTDGVDGMLVDAGDAGAWAAALARLASSPTELATLRAGVRPPRTMRDAAADMAAVYHRVHPLTPALHNALD